MPDIRLKVRVNRSTGEVEIEGPPDEVARWWERLSSELAAPPVLTATAQAPTALLPHGVGNQAHEVFGEYYGAFRSDISDVDKVLVAATFVQNRDPDRTFTTKAANQLLLDQNVKVANASENVRRLAAAKKAFVVADGRYRVSASGLDHLKTLRLDAGGRASVSGV